MIEIIIKDLDAFKFQYRLQIDVLNTFNINFTLTKSQFHDVDVYSNSIRFLQHPHNNAKYIYICDIDILILTDIINLHLPMMTKYNMFYSNVLRPCKNKLTGLHFIEFDKYYPINFNGIDISKNDEELLYDIMCKKYPQGINSSYHFRPCPGIHFSLNRPPLRYTMFSALCSWEFNKYLSEFEKIQYSECYQRIYHYFDIEIKHLILIVEYIRLGKEKELSLYSIFYGIIRDMILYDNDNDSYYIKEYKHNMNKLFCNSFNDHYVNLFLLSLIKLKDIDKAKQLAKTLLNINKQRYSRSKIVMQLASISEDCINDDIDMKQCFTHIYNNNLWGSAETKSGPGSTLKYTVEIRRHLPLLFEKYHIKSIIDAPCGDMHWMKTLIENTSINYLGIDIVDNLIESNRKNIALDNCKFMCGDIRTFPFPESDIMIVRDCLFHFSYKAIKEFLLNFLRGNVTYLLVTSHINNGYLNTDIKSGGWRMLDIFLPPFSFAEPLEKIKDNNLKMLCLFSREQIANLPFLQPATINGMALSK